MTIHKDKYQRKIYRAKALCRTELKPTDWDRHQLALRNWWISDNFPRQNYSKLSVEQFIEEFEAPNKPCVIAGALENWNLENLMPDKLAQTYRNEKFKVGEDDDENVVYLGMKYFMKYAMDPNGGLADDSPLYIFDANFGKRTLHHSARRSTIEDKKHKYDPNVSQATCHIVDDYQVPKYFTEDLFSCLGARRPPFRWLVAGPARSGTGIHVDPLGTSAWNALVTGHKRWALFPPGSPKDIISPKLRDREASTWFSEIYPRMLNPNPIKRTETIGQSLGMIEIVQKPGEVVFVPSGWHHLVMNLDFTVAITQNFCSKTNLDIVWLKTRFARPRMAQKLQSMLTTPTAEILKHSKKKRKVAKEFDLQFKQLELVPALNTSSDSDSTSTEESGTDTDRSVVCQCHGKRRRQT